MKELSSYLLSLLLILLCGCSDNDLMDTYWRDNKTGEWLIGLANEKVVYDCKVWDIATIKDNDGICTIQAECGTEKLDISFGNQQDGKCTISVNGNEAECSNSSTSKATSTTSIGSTQMISMPSPSGWSE